MRGENYDVPHDMTAEISGLQLAIETTLAGNSYEQRNTVLRQAARLIARLDAKYGGLLDDIEKGHEALTRIKNFATNSLPHTIDGGKMHEKAELLIEGES